MRVQEHRKTWMKRGDISQDLFIKLDKYLDTLYQLLPEDIRKNVTVKKSSAPPSRGSSSPRRSISLEPQSPKLHNHTSNSSDTTPPTQLLPSDPQSPTHPNHTIPNNYDSNPPSPSLHLEPPSLPSSNHTFPNSSTTRPLLSPPTKK